MAALPEDLIYVCDRRWWFGGLRSVHLRVAEENDGEDIRISPEALERAHFQDGQTVVVEKII